MASKMKESKLKNKYSFIFERISKIFSYAIISILIFCIVFFAYYFISNQVYKSNPNSKLPRFGLYTIISQSMEPNLKVYDVVVTMTVDSNTIEVGDIISFISSSSISRGLLVTHRVISIVMASNGELSFQTKGDNNIVADSSMAMTSSIIGKVIFKIPQLGRVQFFLAQKTGWLFVVVLPALGVIIYDFIKLFKLLGVNEKMEKLGITDKKIDKDINIEDIKNLDRTYKKITNNKKNTGSNKKKRK